MSLEFPSLEAQNNTNCPQCGKSMPKLLNFCSSCGALLSATPDLPDAAYEQKRVLKESFCTDSYHDAQKKAGVKFCPMCRMEF